MKWFLICLIFYVAAAGLSKYWSNEAAFSQAIAQLASNRELYNSLSKGAVERARRLSWDEKVKRFNEAYLAACPVNRSAAQ